MKLRRKRRREEIRMEERVVRKIKRESDIFDSPVS